MKHLILSLTLVLGMGNLALSQDYRHGIGVGINYALFNQAYTSTSVNYSGTVGLPIPGAYYKASLGFEVGDLTIAASAYPFVGFSYNSQTGGFFGAELPIAAELYLGDPDETCFFLGVGGSAGFYGASGTGSGSILGPQATLGGQFPLKGRTIGLRAGYVYGLNKTKNEDPQVVFTVDKRSMISFGVYYLFG